MMVRGYQLMISPHLGASCRYSPTCSEYSIQALTKYGALKGGILTLYRIGRCAPWGKGGFDPPRWFGEPQIPETGELSEALETPETPELPEALEIPKTPEPLRESKSNEAAIQ